MGPAAACVVMMTRGMGVSHSARAAALPDGGAAGCKASGQDAHCLVALPGVTMGTAVSDRRTSDSQTALRERSV